MSESSEKTNVVENQLETNGFVIINAECNKLRGQLHVWASERKYLHVSFYDEKYSAEDAVCYWCDKCKEWRYSHNDDHCKTVYCCISEDGGQGCRDWTVFCSVCADVNEDGHIERTPIYDQDGYDDERYKIRSYKRNNCVLISKDIDVRSDFNRILFKKIGISYRNVNRQIRRQNEKHKI